MSVAYLTNRISYSCNGASTSFAIPFELLDATHLKIYLRDETVDPITETLLVEGSLADYQLTGADPAHGVIATGITTTATYVTGKKIIIIRIVPESQAAHFLDGSPPPVSSYEDLADKLTMLTQQLQEEIDRSAKFVKTSPTANIDMPEPAANKFLGWNAGGTALQLYTASEIGILLGARLIANGLATFASDVAYETNKGLVGSAGDMYFNTTYGRVRIYRSTGWEFLLQPQVTGTRGTPTLLTASGIPSLSYSHEQLFLVATAAGQVTVTANPQIPVGSYVGQKLKIVGTSNANYPTFSDGTGLSLNGAWDGQLDSVLQLFWDGSNWVEEFRR